MQNDFAAPWGFKVGAISRVASILYINGSRLWLCRNLGRVNLCITTHYSACCLFWVCFSLPLAPSCWIMNTTAAARDAASQAVAVAACALCGFPFSAKCTYVGASEEKASGRGGSFLNRCRSICAGCGWKKRSLSLLISYSTGVA